MIGAGAAERIKQRLAKRYLGVAGIHGIGLLRRGRLLRVFCDPRHSAEQRALLEQLKRDAHPLEVDVVSHPPPRIR